MEDKVIARTICLLFISGLSFAPGKWTNCFGTCPRRLNAIFFAKQNKNGAPIWSLVISCIGILLLLISTTNEDLSEQITEIIDFSVISFLFVYLACSVFFLKLLLTKSEKWLINCLLPMDYL